MVVFSSCMALSSLAKATSNPRLVPFSRVVIALEMSPSPTPVVVPVLLLVWVLVLVFAIVVLVLAIAIVAEAPSSSLFFSFLLAFSLALWSTPPAITVPLIFL